MSKGKSNADKDSTGVCEKMYNAVAGNSAFRAIHRKSGRAHSSIVTNSTDSSHLALQQNPGNAAITRVSVPAKETVAQQKAGPDRVNIEIHLEPPMLNKEEEITANPPVLSLRNGDAANSTPAFVHIQGHEDEVTLRQQEMVKATVASGRKELNKVASDNGSKPTFSSIQEGKIKQERAASPNIIVIQGCGQGINVSPEADQPRKTVTHIPVEGVQANPKSTVLKTTSKQIDLIIHPEKSDNRESKNADQVPATDIFSDYIAHVKDKMRTLSNAGEENENARPAARAATRASEPIKRWR